MKNKVQNFLHFHSGLNIPALILLLFLLSDPIGHRCWNPDYIPLFLAYLIDWRIILLIKLRKSCFFLDSLFANSDFIFIFCLDFNTILNF